MQCRVRLETKFSTEYWTQHVLMSCTVFSKILELINTLQSRESTCKSRRCGHIGAEFQRGNHWLHHALQPTLRFPKSPLLATAFLTPTAPTGVTPGPGGWVWQPTRPALLILLQNCPLPPEGATCALGRPYVCSSLSYQALPLSPAFNPSPS